MKLEFSRDESLVKGSFLNCNNTHMSESIFAIVGISTFKEMLLNQ